MRIFVKAKPNAWEEKVVKLPDGTFVVSVKEPPQNGLANKIIAKALADYFDISIARVTLLSGFSASRKVFEIK